MGFFFKANDRFEILVKYLSLVGEGGHTVTLLLWGGRRGFDPQQLRRAFFPPLAI
jgi:hypothetical protein